MTSNPTSVLFCCDYNAVRSPMAEGIMKKFYGTRIFVQSAGVKNDLDIDGFSVAVCAEIDVALDKHRVRTFHQMEEWGDRIGAYDLISSPPIARPATRSPRASSTASGHPRPPRRTRPDPPCPASGRRCCTSPARPPSSTSNARATRTREKGGRRPGRGLVSHRASGVISGDNTRARQLSR